MSRALSRCNVPRRAGITEETASGDNHRKAKHFYFAIALATRRLTHTICQRDSNLRSGGDIPLRSSTGSEIVVKDEVYHGAWRPFITVGDVTLTTPRASSSANYAAAPF